MSAEAWIGLAGLIFVVLGMLLGAAWWMSALYSRVGSIQTNTKVTNTKIDTLTDKMDGELHDVRHVQRELGRDVANLKERVGKVEGIIEAELGSE
jgi:hypothetical protein